MRTDSYSFNVGLSQDKIKAIVDGEYNKWSQDQVWGNSIYSYGSSLSSSYSYKEPSFGDMLWDTCKQTLTGGLVMGIQALMYRGIACMFGGGGGGGSTEAASSSSGASGASGGMRSLEAIDADILANDADITKIEGLITKHKLYLEQSSEEAGNELKTRSDSLFGSEATKRSTEQQEAVKINNLLSEVESLKKENKVKTAENTQLDDEIKSLNTTISVYQAEAAKFEDAALRTQEVSQQEISQLKGEIAEADTIDEKNTLLGELRSKTAKAQQEQDEQEKGYLDYTIKIQEKEKEVLEKTAKKKENDDAIAKNYESISSKNTELESLKNNPKYDEVEKYQKDEAIYNDYKDKQEELKAAIKKNQATLAELKAEKTALEEERDAVVKAQRDQILANSEPVESPEEKQKKDDAALEYARADSNDGNVWQRGWFGRLFGSKQEKAAKKVEHKNKDDAAAICGGSSEAETRFKRVVADQSWPSCSKMKLNNNPISRARYDEIVMDIKYKKLRDSSNRTNIVQNALKAKGYDWT